MTVQVRAGHRAPLFAMLRGITKVPLYVILLAGAVVSAFPIYWMIVAGTRSTADIYSSPPVLLPGGFLGTNWRSLFEGTTFLGNLGVSLLLATAYTILAGLVSAMAGFALAKYPFRGRQALVTVMLMMMTSTFSTLFGNSSRIAPMRMCLAFRAAKLVPVNVMRITKSLEDRKSVV